MNDTGSNKEPPTPPTVVMNETKRQKTHHPSTSHTSDAMVVVSAVEASIITTTTTNTSTPIMTNISRLRLMKSFGHLLSPAFVESSNVPTTTSSSPKSVVQLYETPYPYGIISQLLLPSFLLQVLNEIKQNSTVQYKESDLYKVYQSIDLANLRGNNNNNDDNDDDKTDATNRHGTNMPSVLELRDLLYSTEFRHYMEDLNQLPRNTLMHHHHNTNTTTHRSTKDLTQDDPNRNTSTVPTTTTPSTTTPSQQIDCACNCHMTTCHLLCHDDVIGTRNISYILYLTAPEPPVWQPSEGGALELYDSFETTSSSACTTSTTNSATTTTTTPKTTLRIPHTVPCQSILPIFNSMVFFVVRPGYSYHSVQEVFGSRPRLSIQGWYHSAAAADKTTTNPTTNEGKKNSTISNEDDDQNKNTTTPTTMNHQYSTLQRLKTYNHQNHLDAKEEDTEGPFIPIVFNQTTINAVETNDAVSTSTPMLLSDEDRRTLQPFICDTYLTEDSMKSIRKRFAHDSSIQLRNFVKETYIHPINTLIQTESNSMKMMIDDVVPNENERNDDDHVATNSVDRITSFYHWGVSPAWKLIGPPHKQRFLEYPTKDDPTIPLLLPPPPPPPPNDLDMDTKPSSVRPQPHQQVELDSMNSSSQHDVIGQYLHYIKHHLFQSEAFYNYISAITHLDSSPIGYRGRIRRFRPGRDYTVAHYGLLTERSVLDATLCFVKETDDDAIVSKDDDGNAEATVKVIRDTDGDMADSNVPDFSEAIELWQSGECGGFDCYIEADDDEDDDDEKKAGPADEYNPDDDTELLNVSASNNTLSLVYRDPGTMRFIKYVSATAPGSRYDIAMEYDFPEMINDDDDIEEEDEDDDDDDDDDDALEYE